MGRDEIPGGNIAIFHKVGVNITDGGTEIDGGDI